LQAHAVHHAVAQKPVIAARSGITDRIGANANVAHLKFGRDRPGDGQILKRQLAVHRHVQTAQIRMRRRWRRPPLAILSGDFHHARRQRPADILANGIDHQRRLTSACTVGIFLPTYFLTRAFTCF
jgi:hypothetical protein